MLVFQLNWLISVGANTGPVADVDASEKDLEVGSDVGPASESIDVLQSRFFDMLNYLRYISNSYLN